MNQNLIAVLLFIGIPAIGQAPHNCPKIKHDAQKKSARFSDVEKLIKSKDHNRKIVVFGVLKPREEKILKRILYWGSSNDKLVTYIGDDFSFLPPRARAMNADHDLLGFVFARSQNMWFPICECDFEGTSALNLLERYLENPSQSDHWFHEHEFDG